MYSEYILSIHLAQINCLVSLCSGTKCHFFLDVGILFCFIFHKFLLSRFIYMLLIILSGLSRIFAYVGHGKMTRECVFSD